VKWQNTKFILRSDFEHWLRSTGIQNGPVNNGHFLFDNFFAYISKNNSTKYKYQSRKKDCPTLKLICAYGIPSFALNNNDND